jgi:DNA-binding response OmpR family regulator
MDVNKMNQALKIIYEGDNREMIELLKDALQATGQLVIVQDPVPPAQKIRKLGHFRFDSDLRMLQWKKEKPVSLSPREGEILALLLDNKGCVVDRTRILSEFWGGETSYTSRSLDVFIYRLRLRLKRDPSVSILTIRGRGYLLR